MAGSKRKPIPKTVELSILDRSRRRCAFCFSLNGDLAEKAGQLAHIDRNPARNREDDLAWLCFVHHSQYDSTTSQHKNLTPGELIEAKRRLEQAVAEGRHTGRSTHRQHNGHQVWA